MKKLITTSYKSILTIIFCLMLFGLSHSNGQGWEKIFGGTLSEAYDIQTTTDGGYIVIGWDGKGFLLKLDINGDSLWKKEFTNTIKRVKQTEDGGYILLGHRELTKTNLNGESIWSKTYTAPPTKGYRFIDFEITSDGGYLITGDMFKLPGFIEQDVLLIRTDSIGDTLWTKTHIAQQNDWGTSIQETFDSGFIIGGYFCDSPYNESGPGLMKIDPSGNTLWIKPMLNGIALTGDLGGYEVKALQTSDSGYILISFGNDSTTSNYLDYHLVKTNAGGDILWTKYYVGPGPIQMNFDGTCCWRFRSDIEQTNDDGYVISGMLFDTLNPSTNNYVYLFKIDMNGDTIWSRKFGENDNNVGLSLALTSDGGYIIAGVSNSYNPLIKNIYIIKTDSLGNSLTNFITGNIFNDLNNDCVQDIHMGENGLSGWKVKLDSGPFYTTTNTNGFYSFRVGLGNHSVSQIIKNELWKLGSNCSGTYSINFSQPYDTSTNNDFGNEIAIYCPKMWVDISTTLLRPCLNNTYTVNYCNNGTVPATNAYIKVRFDSKIMPLSSTLPWNIPQNGNLYTFNLGTVAPGTCGSFYITDSVSCNADIGSAHCVEAHIYPDSICDPIDTSWDGSSIEVKGICIGDTKIRFVIYNRGDPGTGDMINSREYRIYVNNGTSQDYTFQISGGDSLIVPVNNPGGNTYRMEADQHSNHPGKSRPRATVEACGSPNSYGYYIQAPEDDLDDFVEIDCKVVAASMDPNEKTVKPVGFQSSKFIYPDDQLEYQLNFQNTGTDTAYLVVLRDTLSEYLDPGTVVTGGSSHSYKFRMYGKGILEWKFQNIMLPDSNIDEGGSHGFVKFKVDQQPGNPKGTVINNRVNIWFDFNAPIITNTVFNTIDEYDTSGPSTVVKPVIYSNNVTMQIYPNPFNTKTNVVIQGESDNLKNLSFRLFDIMGREVLRIANIPSKQFQITNEGLSEGFYFYKVTNDKGIIGTGKLVLQK